jgi:hypothetical protein
MTDDILVLRGDGNGFAAFPGPPRIKLFPEIGRSLLGDVSGTPMNPLTPKLIIPLRPDRVEQTARPLKAIYVLRPPTAQAQTKKIVIGGLRPRDAVLKLVGNTFNTIVRDRDRLARQFRKATEIAARVPLRIVRYPRDLSQLAQVVDRIRSDLRKCRRPPLRRGVPWL